MKGYFTFTFQEGKPIDVTLECHAVGIWFDCNISNGTICKKVQRGLNANREVIDLKQE